MKALNVPLGYVEGLNDARTMHGKRRVPPRRGWAGEKSDFFSTLLARRPSEVAPAQDMEMKVKHALPTMCTGIDDKSVPSIGNSL